MFVIFFEFYVILVALIPNSFSHTSFAVTWDGKGKKVGEDGNDRRISMMETKTNVKVSMRDGIWREKKEGKGGRSHQHAPSRAPSSTQLSCMQIAVHFLQRTSVMNTFSGNNNPSQSLFNMKKHRNEIVLKLVATICHILIPHLIFSNYFIEIRFHCWEEI